jgi:hypothetical protein
MKPGRTVSEQQCAFTSLISNSPFALSSSCKLQQPQLPHSTGLYPSPLSRNKALLNRGKTKTEGVLITWKDARGGWSVDVLGLVVEEGNRGKAKTGIHWQTRGMGYSVKQLACNSGRHTWWNLKLSLKQKEKLCGKDLLYLVCQSICQTLLIREENLCPPVLY